MQTEIVLLALLVICVWQLGGLRKRLDDQAVQLKMLLDQLGVKPGELSEPSDEVKRLAHQPGQQIAAIRAYRQQTGADLKRAKAVIDRLAANGS